MRTNKGGPSGAARMKDKKVMQTTAQRMPKSWERVVEVQREVGGGNVYRVWHTPQR